MCSLTKKNYRRKKAQKRVSLSFVCGERSQADGISTTLGTFGDVTNIINHAKFKNHSLSVLLSKGEMMLYRFVMLCIMYEYI
jgi:hypothetical protein